MPPSVFNFRGVGNSDGEHTKGELEYQEILGAFDLLKAWPGVDERNLGLAGYSFGTSVILGSAAAQKKSQGHCADLTAHTGISGFGL